ncbi:ribosomal protein L37AE/L43A [Polaromonas sp. CG_9.5]|nr:ribosomal protein L37AE/L43A [Polaromonas sp. CG_9.5]
MENENGEYASEVCPECGSEEFKFVYAGGMDVLVCQSCGYEDLGDFED